MPEFTRNRKLERLLREPLEMHMDMSQEPSYVWRAQSKCTWTSHKKQFMQIYAVKKCRAPRSRRTVCASLRTQNAHGHVTKAISCENLPRAYPDLTPLYDLPPEPLSVDTLLGKKGDLSLQLNEAGHLRVGLLNFVGWAPSPIPCFPEDAWLNSRSKSTMRKFNPLETFTNI